LPPVCVGCDCGHERVGRQDGEIEVAQAARLALGGDEILDIRVIAPHRRHHGTPPRAGGHDGAAHRIPDIHERQWPGGVGTDAVDGRALRPERGEVVADATALLHG
jgi:hypothetical protein